METFNNKEVLRDAEIQKPLEETFSDYIYTDAELLALWAYNFSSDFIQKVDWVDNIQNQLQERWNTMKGQGMAGCSLAITFFLELSQPNQRKLIDWYRTTFN